MSRCFPFPPPGYEKKARTDDVDLLKKEKHKEKKHKKEKKDKEKREDKDRKDKDKSDRKHRDKKDRKEKSKEKKKDEERENDRDKTSISSDKKIPAQVESYNGDHKLNYKEREWAMAQNITSNQKIQNTQFLGHIGDKPVEKSLYDEGSMDKFVLDLCGRIKDEEKGSASQSTVRSPFTGRTNHDRMVKNENGIMPMEKEKKMDKRVDIRKRDGQGVSVGATISASKMIQNIVGKDKNENKGANIGGGFQNKAEESPWILKSIEPRDKNHKKESEDKRESKQNKDKHKEKKSHGKDKEREKKKKKKEIAKEKNEQKTNDHDKVKDSVKNGLVFGQIIKLPPFVPNGDGNLVVPQNIKLPQLDRDGDRNHILDQNIKLPPFVPDGDRTSAVEGNLKKRKDFEANGFLHETNIVPNKKLRPTPHPSIQNGRKLEPCQTPVLCTPDRKVSPPNNLIKANNNEHKVNGKIEVQPLAISLKKPSSSSSSSSSSSKTKADQITKAPPVKLPHPDTKYLGEVLSVPKIEECFDFDDEEWLFSSKGRVSVSAGLTEASETTRVWAQAVQIESADVCALPYVIPY